MRLKFLVLISVLCVGCEEEARVVSQAEAPALEFAIFKNSRTRDQERRPILTLEFAAWADGAVLFQTTDWSGGEPRTVWRYGMADDVQEAAALARRVVCEYDIVGLYHEPHPVGHHTLITRCNASGEWEWANWTDDALLFRRSGWSEETVAMQRDANRLNSAVKGLSHGATVDVTGSGEVRGVRFEMSLLEMPDHFSGLWETSN